MSIKMDWFKIFDRPIAFQRLFVDITGSITAALMLSQAVYWARRTADPDGWFYKTGLDWEKETGLQRREQETAREKLRKTGFWLEELRGAPARMYYKIDEEGLQTSLHDSCKLDGTNPPNKIAQKRQTLISENTTKITTENPPNPPQAGGECANTQATKRKTAANRRIPRNVENKVKAPKGSRPMTADTLLEMAPVYELLKESGIDPEKIPIREFKLAVGMWRRDRIAKGQWRTDWQEDGKNFLLSYAENHDWRNWEPEHNDSLFDSDGDYKPHSGGLTLPDGYHGWSGETQDAWRAQAYAENPGVPDPWA